MSSADLTWEIIRNSSSFVVKRDGAHFNREPANLYNVNARKYSGLANDKAIGLSIVTTTNAAGKELQKVKMIVKRTKSQYKQKPSQQFAVDTLRRHKVAKKHVGAAHVRKATVGSHYRPDLARLAVARYHALRKAIQAKKGIRKQKARVRTRKNKQ
eukprot:CAMPEP_0183353372 /NCGR_PEP_ID=MMETSP0164_2-20130417/33219_1 /TAXON_ID=221442 /ORGANISM="Coccolithus pelagicus ssp braarudi, Strain PLY182g" /LENGTH=155 /DNA_ID=CAMNT_0025526033 /DNA_START=45 /DNA_END=512 /DNA_ORIENTATION=-